jgi:hypothetical protein
MGSRTRIASRCTRLFGRAAVSDSFRFADDTPGTKIVIAEAEQAIGDNHRLHGRRWRSQSPVPGIHQDPVFCPLPGEVHGLKDNTGDGNYGPTILCQTHRLRWGNDRLCQQGCPRRRKCRPPLPCAGSSRERWLAVGECGRSAARGGMVGKRGAVRSTESSDLLNHSSRISSRVWWQGSSVTLPPFS